MSKLLKGINWPRKKEKYLKEKSLRKEGNKKITSKLI